MGISIISGIIFLMCCFLVIGKKTDTIDKKVSTFVTTHRKNGVTFVMHFFTELGKGVPTILVCLSFLFFVNYKYLLQSLVIVLLSTVILCRGLKITIQRERPKNNRLVEEIDYSFPSSHALTSAALYGTIAFNMVDIVPQLQSVIIVICVLFPFLIGFSRVYLGIHYLFDIVGGWSLGLCIASLVYYL